MSIQQISLNSVAANPANVNTQVRTEQTSAAPQVNQDARKAVEAIKTDTVTISQEALQKLARDRDAAQETKEKSDDEAREERRKKK